MPTFLTTRKMDAALVQRIHESLRGGARGTQRVHRSPGKVALTRVLMGITLLLLLVYLTLAWREQVALFNDAKSELRAATAAQAARVSKTGWQLLPAVQLALEQAAEATPTEIDTKESSANPTAVTALLQRPLLYIRANLGDVSSTDQLERAALDSNKDAFIACWVAPPDGLDESVLLKKVRSLYRGDLLRDGSLTHVHRLSDLFFVHKFLGPGWLAQLDAARDVTEVTALQRKFEATGVADRIPSTAATVLVYLLDEPMRPGTVSELDGAHDHFVRVGVVEFEHTIESIHTRTRFTARRRLDPSWISPQNRPRFASGLDACRLAADLTSKFSVVGGPPD